MSDKKNEGKYLLYYEDQFSQEDLEERRLYLNGAIGEFDGDNVASDIVYHIFRYNKMDNDIPVEERKPIYLYINSPGGSVVDGFSIVDAILLSKTPVYTVNLALSASMAFYIFAAGHKRIALPHSEFLLHEGQVGSFNNTLKVKDQIDFETNQVSTMIKKFVLEHTEISEADYDKNERTEWYMLACEAKELGVVDLIAGEDCDIDMLYFK